MHVLKDYPYNQDIRTELKNLLIEKDFIYIPKYSFLVSKANIPMVNKMFTLKRRQPYSYRALTQMQWYNGLSASIES